MEEVNLVTGAQKLLAGALVEALPFIVTGTTLHHLPLGGEFNC
jgi:hypothetical protein